MGLTEVCLANTPVAGACAVPRRSKMSLHEACRKYFTRDVNNLVRFTKLLSLHSRHTVRRWRVLCIVHVRARLGAQSQGTQTCVACLGHLVHVPVSCRMAPAFGCSSAAAAGACALRPG